MDQLQKEDVVQALLIADNFNNNFLPITKSTSVSLLPLVNTPLLDYSLEALNRSGVEDVFIFCSTHIERVREYIKEGIAKKCSWSVEMNIQVVGSEGCRCLGDALRDLDAKGLIRGNFILLGCDTVTNAQLSTILEQHKRNCKFDKGAALTVVYKKISTGPRTGDEVVIAVDKDSNRLLFHQRIKPLQKAKRFKYPLEMLIGNTGAVIHQDLIDPQIAICAPTVLTLFTDNFDFENRDDFIRGLLINEEVLGCSIYYTELPAEQYAAKVSNWHTYHIISKEVINRWAYPLVPDMGISCLKQNYLFLRNNIYRSKDVQLARGGILKEDVVIQENCSVDDGSILSNTVVGKNCKIGKNCILDHAFIFENVTVQDNCVLRYCVIGKSTQILKGSTITEGAVIDDNVTIDENSKVVKHFVQATQPDFDKSSIKLGKQAFTISDREEANEFDSDDEDQILPTGAVRMAPLNCHYELSVYSSSSEDDNESRDTNSIPDDSKMFLSEVIDSLTRGFDEKSNPDFLILEINSSRYAYNIELTEVNFLVVKAIMALRPITELGKNMMSGLKLVLDHLGPVLKNYIRGDDAMLDCLDAIEDYSSQNENIKSKAPQIIHYLYDQEIVSEDVILKWHSSLDAESEWIKSSLQKLVDWLMAASEEESSEDD